MEVVHKHKGYVTLGVLPIDTFLPFIGSKSTTVEFFGVHVKTGTIRLLTYIKGTTCVVCGLAASYWAVQVQKQGSPHVNLWGIVPETGLPRMITSDHWHARSKGGPNENVANRLPMCEKCNTHKSDHDFNSVEELRDYIVNKAIPRAITNKEKRKQKRKAWLSRKKTRDKAKLPNGANRFGVLFKKEDTLVLSCQLDKSVPQY